MYKHVKMTAIGTVLIASAFIGGASFAQIPVFSDDPLRDGELTSFIEIRDNSSFIAAAAKAASAAYNDNELVDDTRQRFENLERAELAESGQEIINFSANISGSGHTPTGFVTYKEAPSGKAQITVAFHGTENGADILTDLKAFKKKNDLLGIPGYIHGGINDRYMQSRESIIDILEAVLAVHKKKASDVEFLVTGHSLGGALATLAAADIKANLAKGACVELVTHCSPRVVDHKGAKYIEGLLDRAIRVWRGNDLVPMVSLGSQFFFGFLTGFKHVGESVKLKSASFLPLLNHSLALIKEDAVSKIKVKIFEHEGIRDWIKRKTKSLPQPLSRISSKVSSLWGRS